MGQVLSDVLPQDAGSQKFIAPINPDDANFALLWAIAKQTFSGKDYAFLGTLTGWNTDTTHNALSVSTTPVKRGMGGSATAAVDARGFNKCTVFAVVSGLTGGATLAIQAVPRYTQTGSDYVPATVVVGTLSNGNNVAEFDVISPYLMIEAIASAGTATVTIYLYLHRG
jgi:hypothetical protein